MSLELLLRERQPDVRLVPQRRLLKYLHWLQARGERVVLNPDMPLWTTRDQLQSSSFWPDSDLVDFPSEVLLLTPPDDRALYHLPTEVLVDYYTRLILLGRAENNWRQRDARSILDAWHSLDAAVQREIEYVLMAEHRLPESPHPEEVARAFFIYYSELQTFQPGALPVTFPLLPENFQPLEGCFLSHPLNTETAARQKEAENLTGEQHTGSIEAATFWLERNNFIRAAIDAPWDSPIAEEALRRLVQALLTALQSPADNTAGWLMALHPLVMAARRATWPHEARALYDLQRLVADFQGPIDVVAPVECLLAFGRKPLRRPLEPVRDILVCRRLRAAEKHIERSALSLEDRRRVEALLEAEIDRLDTKIHEQFEPVLRRIFDDAKLKPESFPEQIGRDKAIAELLDRLSESGYLRMADVRDALARNSLKLPDSTVLDLIRGDALLHIDRRLHDELFGVYHRGEIYLRAFQRFSSAAFGTSVGRAVTLWAALPFGGAFLAVEASKHVGHAVEKVGHILSRIVHGTPAPPAVHHATSLDPATITAVAILGLFLLLLINVPSIRAVAMQYLFKLGNVLRILVLTLPRRVLTWPAVQWLINNAITRAARRHLILPSLVALTAMLLAVIYDLRATNLIIATGLGTFVAMLVISFTPWGDALREDAEEMAHDFGRRLFTDIVPGVINWILWLFRELLGWVERGLYAVDEWFRYREAEAKPSLWVKVILALLWFPIAYVVRFVFYLLFEPQVNPIKHFPVVTVSHKVLLPLIPSLANMIHVTIETATMIITMIPGIFGFLVWEFKENWRLYRANRPRNLPNAQIGHHGESMRGLLRPGFHSGTVPKLYRKLRRLLTGVHPQASLARRDLLDHELHHVKVAVARLLERDLIAYWREMPEIAQQSPRVDRVRLGCQRIEASIVVDSTSSPLWLAFENSQGTIAASVMNAGWTAALSPVNQHRCEVSIRGLFAVAAAGRMRWDDWCRTWPG